MSFAILSAGACLVAPAARPQQQEMTARDMFHSAAGLVAPAPAPPAAAASKTGRSARAKAAKPAAPQPPEAARSTVPVRPQGEPGRSTVPAGGVSVTPVSLTSEKPAIPLGLRYSILKQSGGEAVEVDADHVFRSGERIRLTIESNDAAYLYIVQRGSSGNWSVLFPSREISGGDNRVERGRIYEIPPRHWFAFDEQAGEEKLFIVLSRKPEPNLEKMIYSIRQGQDSAPAAPAPAAEEPPKTLLAQNIGPIDDGLVNQIRSQVFARDLIFEKVDENTGGEKKEKAVYVVDRTGRADSRVVADVTLHHK
jgi:hypothetical protein